MAIKAYKNGRVDLVEGGVSVVATTSKSRWPTIEVQLWDREKKTGYNCEYTVMAEGSTNTGSRVIYVPLETEPYLPPTMDQKIEAAKKEYERYKTSKQGSLLKKSWDVGKVGDRHEYIWVYLPRFGAKVSDKYEWHPQFISGLGKAWKDIVYNYDGGSKTYWRGVVVVDEAKKIGQVFAYEGPTHNEAVSIPNDVWSSVKKYFPDYDLKETSTEELYNFEYGRKTKAVHASLLTKQADIEDDEYACSNCGADMEGERYCPSCGHGWPQTGLIYDQQTSKEFNHGMPELKKKKKADVPADLEKLDTSVSKEFDAVMYVYRDMYNNQITSIPWRDFQKRYQQFAQKYNKLFTDIRHNKPQVTLGDLYDWLETAREQQTERYKLDYDQYNDPETSFRDVEQLVVRINQSADAQQIIGQDRVFKEYVKMVSQGGEQSGHPVAETTVGWLRLDFINDEWLLVDEIQSDLVNSVTQAKAIIMEPSFESFFEHLTNPHVREKVQEKVTPELFDGLKRHFIQKGYTPEKLDEIKDKLVELFQDWAEYGLSSILEIARKHGIKNVAIHTAETIARRDESVEADKVKMYYDNLSRSFGFRKQQLDTGDLKGTFWVRQAKFKSALLNKQKPSPSS